SRRLLHIGASRLVGPFHAVRQVVLMAEQEGLTRQSLQIREQRPRLRGGAAIDRRRPTGLGRPTRIAGEQQRGERSGGATRQSGLGTLPRTTWACRRSS